MALTGWLDAANYLTRAAAVWPGALPFYVSIWGNRATSHASYAVAWSLGLTTLAHRRLLYGTPTGGSLLTIEERDASGSVSQAVASAHPNNTWFHIGGAFHSTIDHKVYMNTVTAPLAAAASAITTPTNTYIGIAPALDTAWQQTGGLAEISVWNASGWTFQTDYDSLDVKLRAGQNPLNITAESSQPWTGKLVAYWPLTNTSTLTDSSGNGHTLSMVGTITNFASHPTIEAAGGVNTDRTPGTMIKGT